MPVDRPTRLTIEIHSCSERIRGHVLDDQDGRRPFETWLSLLDLIHRAAEPAADGRRRSEPHGS